MRKLTDLSIVLPCSLILTFDQKCPIVIISSLIIANVEQNYSLVPGVVIKLVGWCYERSMVLLYALNEDRYLDRCF